MKSHFGTHTNPRRPPKKLPTLADVNQLENNYRGISEYLPRTYDKDHSHKTIYTDDNFYSISPIQNNGVILGNLVLVYSKQYLFREFRNVLISTAIICSVILFILLPLNWFWGRKTAAELVELTDNIVALSNGRITTPETIQYQHDDELGKLLKAHLSLIGKMKEKKALEENIIRSERLTAIGRLSAGIAHEINNPLGGIMLALDNFKNREKHSEKTLKTLSLLERGLSQIHDTVSAILVDVNIENRYFIQSDLDDIRLLLSPEIKKQQVTLVCHAEFNKAIQLPSTQIRQILMNLLTNAIQASDVGGTVTCQLSVQNDTLTITTENGGEPIPPSSIEHLFEPFTTNKPDGHGIGLWVVYQIVTKLGGTTVVHATDEKTLFKVSIPTRVQKQ